MRSVIFLLSTILLLIISCKDDPKIPGCTDLDSTSYNPAANENDGSCAYPRDVFIGTWSGPVDCSKDFDDDPNFFIQISIVDEATDEVNVDFLCCPKLIFTAKVVDENTLMINYKRPVQDYPNRCNTPTTILRQGFFQWQTTLVRSGNTLKSQLSTESLLDGDGKVICSENCRYEFTKI
ncbi:MAG: hypothetical protein H6561_03300 [Lewinellaceae bacterium]|nr:hypothetical protein [Lewinellaceae bacterium]